MLLRGADAQSPVGKGVLATIPAFMPEKVHHMSSMPDGISFSRVAMSAFNSNAAPGAVAARESMASSIAGFMAGW